MILRILAMSFTLICLNSQRLHPNQREAVILWNVGQGQWVTWIKGTKCAHFDMGGEHAPFKPVQELCQRRQNPVTISHWDYDHLNLVSRFKRTVYNHCYTKIPLGNPSPRKQKIFSTWQPCKPITLNNHLILFPLSKDPLSQTSNGLSRVALIKGRVLLPGDSTRHEEKLWAPRLRKHPVSDLILGHHGSLTSTSDFVLNALPHLKRAYASARKERYGHPHEKIVLRLKKRGISVIKTEDWGSIILPQ